MFLFVKLIDKLLISISLNPLILTVVYPPLPPYDTQIVNIINKSKVMLLLILESLDNFGKFLNACEYSVASD